MHLKELHLSGFKSFAQPVRIELGPGITAVVGPNGSGKSNIVDAVRWVLGEQNPRALRGARSEDVIFTGSAARHPLGMAEVTLVLDNGEGRVHLDLAEIAIGRRLYRSGETEYLLNRRRARLRDVLDVAGQAGLGPDSYCVVGQGAIEHLMLQRPQERRALIADVADIRRHEARLAEIESDLAQTQTNALRVTAVLAEIRPQLDRLKGQAERAERHRRAREELEVLAAAWYARARRGAQRGLEEAEAGRSALGLALAEARADLKAAEARRAGLQQRGGSLRARSAALQEEIGRARVAREAALVERVGLAERLEGLGRRSSDLLGELVAPVEQETAAREALARNRAALGDAEAASAQESGIGDRGSGIEDLWPLAPGPRPLTPEVRDRLDAARRQLNRLNRQESRLRAASDAALAARASVATRRSEAQGRIDDLTSRLEWLVGSLEDLRSRASSAGGRGARLRSEHAARLAELRGAETRLTAATHALDNLVGEERALAAVAGENETGEGSASLLACLACPPEYQRAIATALGSAAAYLVVDAEGTAWFAPDPAQGVAGLVPERREPDGETAAFRSWVQSALPEGAMYRIAVDVLDPTSDRWLADRYLGETIIVESIAEARAAALRLAQAAPSPLSRRDKGGAGEGWGGGYAPFQVVTLDGQCLRSGGERVLRPAAGQLAEVRLRQHELGIRLVEARSESEEAKTLVDRARDAEAGAREALAAVDDECRRLAAEIRQGEEGLAAVRKDLESEERRLNALVDPMEDVAAASALADLVERRAALSAEIDELVASLQAHAALVEAAERQRRAAGERYAAIASERAVAEERLRHLQEAVRRDERDLAQLMERRDHLQTEHAQCEAQTQTAREALEAVVGRLALAEEELRRLQREGAERAAALASHEAEAQTLMSAYEEAQARVADLRAAEAAAGAEVERARGGGERLRAQLALVADALGVEIASLVEGEEFLPSAARHPLWPTLQAMDDEALERRLSRAQRDLRGVGGADYGSMADYAALRDRYTYLSAQLEDLAQTESRIREGMEEVRDHIRDQFRRAFDLVNDRFKDAFRDLFGGGEAELVLTAEPDDPQCGIDVVAQPPGKRQHRMATLSGGERSLIGGALLLSLVAANPGPFCMFDEVDAALDDTNIQRFIGAIREMARETQFILVTHNRATMEMADALYGVTMSPSAVSQIVGIRLPEN